ncbi:hypothetical protein [Vannielia litorea]|uniref:Uncharacterized protein n=1 Tax=Vannielia litorea TaxID=1217970 RepID=A0A1N6FTA2_9RHOB|nr:hypothetical protein [Vannielia litorea]SIN98556.1 hypothetical protein SAMN05444002_1944 [Vannielia litorea]
MSRVLFFLLLTAGATGLLAHVALNPQLWEPWLADRGITRDSATFRTGLKLVLAIVPGLPLAALIYAIARLGSDRAQTDIHGYTVLKLRAGMRWFSTLSCLGLSALFFAYPMVDPHSPAPWAFQAVAVVCLFAIPVLLKARVRYDNATLEVANTLGGRSRHNWSDLTEVRDVPPLKAWELRFSTGKKASVSYHYAGLEGFLDTAQSKLAVRPRAGTATPPRRLMPLAGRPG